MPNHRHITMTTRTGKFNFMDPGEETWVLSIHNLPTGAPKLSVSEHWDIGSEPYWDVDMVRPSTAAALIKERAGEYWINTSRDETIAVCDWIIKHADELDACYLRGRLESLDRRIEDLGETRALMIEALEDIPG